jgi:hypothetical protein
MADRFNVKAWRKVNGSRDPKYYTVQIGSAWVDNKGVIRMNFDALPVADENGQVQCFLEKREDQAAQAQEPLPR